MFTPLSAKYPLWSMPLATVVVLTVGSAHAQSARDEDRTHEYRSWARHSPGHSTQQSRSEWYGWQNLVLDGTSLLILGIAADSGNHDWASEDVTAGMGVTGGLVFTLGAPTNHWSRGYVGRGVRSLVLRTLGFALAGAASGIDVTDPFLRGRWEPPGPLVFAIPAGITIVLDALATEP
jgi:hypothetical protein